MGTYQTYRLSERIVYRHPVCFVLDTHKHKKIAYTLSPGMRT